jgi:hypothetical protein
VGIDQAHPELTRAREEKKKKRAQRAQWEIAKMEGREPHKMKKRKTVPSIKDENTCKGSSSTGCSHKSTNHHECSKQVQL